MTSTSSSSEDESSAGTPRRLRAKSSTGGVWGRSVQTERTGLLIDAKRYSDKDLGYTSLGGGHVSPEGHAPTDYFAAHKSGIRTKRKLFYVGIVIVLLAALAAVVFFFVPRDVAIKQVAVEASGFGWNVTTRGVTMHVEDSMELSNPNYASVLLEDITLRSDFREQMHSKGIPICSLTHSFQHSYPPRAFNKGFSFSDVCSGILSNSTFTALREAYLNVCSRGKQGYFFLSFGGHGNVKLLSVTSSVSIAPNSKQMFCDGQG